MGLYHIAFHTVGPHYTKPISYTYARIILCVYLCHEFTCRPISNEVQKIDNQFFECQLRLFDGHLPWINNRNPGGTKHILCTTTLNPGGTKHILCTTTLNPGGAKNIGLFCTTWCTTGIGAYEDASSTCTDAYEGALFENKYFKLKKFMKRCRI